MPMHSAAPSAKRNAAIAARRIPGARRAPTPPARREVRDGGVLGGSGEDGTRRRETRRSHHRCRTESRFENDRVRRSSVPVKTLIDRDEPAARRRAPPPPPSRRRRLSSDARARRRPIPAKNDYDFQNQYSLRSATSLRGDGA